jgi:predicted nucleic-acid-binding protein
MRAVDANVLVRLITADDEVVSAALQRPARRRDEATV